MVISRGGELQEWELIYRGQKPLVMPGLLGPTGLTVERPGAPAQIVDFSLSGDRLVPTPEKPDGELRLAGEAGSGLRISETLRFRADNYTVERVIRVENRSATAQSADLSLAWRTPVEWPKDRAEQFQGQHPIRIVGLFQEGLRREDLAHTATRLADGTWIALESEWYLSALIPKSPGFKLVEAKVNGTAQVGVRVTLPKLEPGQAWEGTVLSYVGPKEYDRLKAFGIGLEKAIYFGGFPLPQNYGGLPMEWVTVPLLWLMHLFYTFTQQLRRRDHPAHGDHEGALLPAHREEHAVDEGDAGASSRRSTAPLEVQERYRQAPAGDDGAVPPARREPARRLPADDRADPDLLRALRGAVRRG